MRKILIPLLTLYWAALALNCASAKHAAPMEPQAHYMEESVSTESEDYDGRRRLGDSTSNRRGQHKPSVQAAPGNAGRDRTEDRSQSAENTAQTPDKPEQPAQPMVVYQGFLKLRVRQLMAAADQITILAEQSGGHVQSLTERVIVVRVPATDFEQVMDQFAAVGDLLDRRVQAYEVTAQFLDVTARLEISKQSRQRLMALMKEAKTHAERLRILNEIKRLSEQIEAMEAQLTTLKNLVDFFTITIEMVPVLKNQPLRQNCSAFSWIAGLRAHQVTVVEGKDRLKLDLPNGFVLFEEDETYRALAADNTVIRGGYVLNEPVGDNSFWSQALQHEMLCRDEELVDQVDGPDSSYVVYRNKDIRPRYYLVALAVKGDRVYVVEVFYPDETAYKKHQHAVAKALETLRVD